MLIKPLVKSIASLTYVFNTFVFITVSSSSAFVGLSAGFFGSWPVLVSSSSLTPSPSSSSSIVSGLPSLSVSFNTVKFVVTIFSIGSCSVVIPASTVTTIFSFFVSLVTIFTLPVNSIVSFEVTLLVNPSTLAEGALGIASRKTGLSLIFSIYCSLSFPRPVGSSKLNLIFAISVCSITSVFGLLSRTNLGAT